MVIIILLLALATSAQEVNPEHFCKSSFDFQFKPESKPQNREHLFDYCRDHAANTCCQLHQVDMIRKRVEAMPTNDKCKFVSSQVFCANCDSDIGTDQRQGICQHVCDVWYDACQYSSYCQEPHFDNCPSGGQQLYWITPNSTDFCERMGYPVNTDNSKCWDGIPTAHKV